MLQMAQEKLFDKPLALKTFLTMARLDKLDNIRKDRKGRLIIKGSKRHRVTF
jgi:hypothetical protein